MIGQEIADHNEQILEETGYEALFKLYSTLAEVMPQEHPQAVPA